MSLVSQPVAPQFGAYSRTGAMLAHLFLAFLCCSFCLGFSVLHIEVLQRSVAGRCHIFIHRGGSLQG